MTTRILQSHPEVVDALDRPSDDDREWFRTHPGQAVRLRPEFPDELEALAAMDRAAGQGTRPRISGIGADGSDLPSMWLAVVDLLRLAGLPHGPDGESGRAKFACPEPLDAAMAGEIAAVALATVRASLPAMPRPPAKGSRRGRRGNGRGFGH